VAYTPSHYHDWVHLLLHEFSGGRGPAQHAARLRGTMLHYALSLINNLHGADNALVLQQAAAAACARFPSVMPSIELLVELEKITSAPALKPIFYVQGFDVFCEKEFALSGGEIRRVDRLLVSKTSVIIADFKSAKQKATDHHAQVRQYMALAAELYIGRKISGIIAYLDSRETEEVVL